MNRLFSKLKDFGLIISQKIETDDQVIILSKALKRAFMPVALFDFFENQSFNSIRLSNENEDMFLGARCANNFSTMKKAIASGAHFLVCEKAEKEIIGKCREQAFDLIVPIYTIDEIRLSIQWGAEALLVDSELDNHGELIDFILNETTGTLFLRGSIENLSFKKFRNEKNAASLIIVNPYNSEDLKEKKEEEIINETAVLIKELLDLKYVSLTVRFDSPHIEDARVFTALSSIPLLITEKEEEQLLISTGDMDRTIAHLKWKDIYIDPFSSKMNHSKIEETKLYEEFLGWPVKLIHRP